MSQYQVARGPARLDTEPDRVWFRTGNDVLPSLVFVIWDGGDRVAISVANEINDGMGVLITLDDLARMRHALDEILTRTGVSNPVDSDDIRKRLDLELIDDAFCDVAAEYPDSPAELRCAIDRLHAWREKHGMTYEPFEGEAS